MSSFGDRRAALARRIRARKLTIAPGVFDMISARVADRAGFDALYMTGYGIAASHMGLPDAGLVSYTDMLGRAARICEGTRTPLIADADTGFGGLLNVRHTVCGYEAAGVAAIQIEDQEFPKKCGHAPGRRVVPLDDMVRKVAVAVDARAKRRLPRHRAHRLAQLARAGRGHPPGTGVRGRRRGRGVHRGARIRGRIRTHRAGDRRAAAREHGRRRLLPRSAGKDPGPKLGFAVAIYPGTGFLSAAKTLEAVYGHLKANGSSIDSGARQLLDRRDARVDGVRRGLGVREAVGRTGLSRRANREAAAGSSGVTSARWIRDSEETSRHRDSAVAPKAGIH